MYKTVQDKHREYIVTDTVIIMNSYMYPVSDNSFYIVHVSTW